MKKTFPELNQEKLIYLLIFLGSLIFVLNKGAIYLPDSDGYLQMSLFRSCGYPVFIAFHKYIFGENFISVLIFTQFIFTFLASLFFTKSIQKIFNLNKWLAIILFIALLSPVFIRIKVSNLLLSEAIAYPLYLFILGNVFLGIIYKQNKKFYLAFILTFILILVRGQFLFLIPVLVIAVILTYNRFFNTKFILLLLSIIIIPFLAVFTDIAFHKLKHNQAVKTPWTGIQIVTIPFFVSDKDDYLLFENKEQQNYFKFIYNKLEQKKLLQKQIPEYIDKIAFFSDNYCLICNSTINDDGVLFFDKNLSNDQKIILNDKMTSSMTIALIKNNLAKCVIIYKDNFIKGFGEISNLLLFLILLPLSFFSLLKKDGIISKFIMLCCFLSIGNIAIIAIAEKTIERYTFYNNWIVIAIILILFQNYLKNKTNE